MASKAELHRLVEELSEEELQTAQRFLEYLRAVASDSLCQALNAAPFDDEPSSDEEDREAEGRWRQRNEARPWHEVRKTLPDE